MKTAPNPPDERARQMSVDALGLDALWSEPDFDRVTRLAAKSLQVPIASFSVITGDREINKSAVGVESYSTQRAVSFCAHTILSNDVMVVPDACTDERFSDNPLVVGEPKIRFYMGAPVHAPDGAAVGAICCADREPRAADAEQRMLIGVIARMFESELLLRSMNVRDPLTGTYARGSFGVLAENSWRRARSLGLGSGLIVLSVDRYLSLMRASGRYGIDQILQQVGRCIGSTAGPGERILGRMHDDRFALYMTFRDVQDLHDTADRLRQNVEQLGTMSGRIVSRPITASIGVAAQGDTAGGCHSFTDLLDRAYAALTRAKSGGGNRIERAAA